MPWKIGENVPVISIEVSLRYHIIYYILLLEKILTFTRVCETESTNVVCKVENKDTENVENVENVVPK